jgi:hypothetical protein
MKAENTALRAANEQLSQRRKRKKKFLKERHLSRFKRDWN